MDILIKNVLLNNRKVNILVRNGRFECLDAAPGTVAEKELDADGCAVLPAFYNTHTHAAMTLLRGYGDDNPLNVWLQEYVWPYEDKLTAEDIRRGSEMACREMISTGTVFFNDMYFDIDGTMDEVDKAGMRASIGITIMDNHSKAVSDEKARIIRDWKDRGNLTLAVAPHAIYTVGRERLIASARLARENGRKLHISQKLPRRCKTAWYRPAPPPCAIWTASAFWAPT